MELDRLAELLGYVERGGYLGVGTEPYARSERAAWRREPTSVGRRDACVRATARAIRAHREQVERQTDDGYARAHQHRPLSDWPVRPHELGHHARARGVEGRPYHERLPGFGPVRASMSGWGWYRVGDPAEAPRLTFAELSPILGDLAYVQGAPRWAAGDPQ